jgi:hypothetical protein
MLEQWQCPPHRMRTVRRRIYAAHLTVYRGIIEQLEQVEIDAFPTAFVTTGSHGGQVHRTAQLFDRYHARFNCRQNDTCRALPHSTLIVSQVPAVVALSDPFVRWNGSVPR